MRPVRDVRFRGLPLFLVAVCLGVGWTSAARAENRVVTVPYTSVRSAPFDVAPEIARLQAGDRIQVDDQPQGAWRRVVLPGGRYGFVRDDDTQHSETGPDSAGPTVDGGAQAASTSVPPPPPAVITSQEAFGPPTAPLLGVTFELLPVGTLSANTQAGGSGVSNDAVFAVGVSAFVDASLSPYIAVGVSPQVIFRIKGDGVMEESSKEFDLRARLTGRLPLSQKVRVFGRLSPGWSVIDLADVPGVDRSNPKGFVMDFSVGAEVAVLPRLFLVSGLGYQTGFQSTSDVDFRTSYLHLGAGFAIGL